MIKKVTKIKRIDEFDDSVEIGWFDMKKPNLTATTNNGVDFIIKVNFSHLHEGNILECEDGYKIKVQKAEDTMYELQFTNPMDFAKTAYEIGNRHQPISIQDDQIVVLDDISIHDIIAICRENEAISVKLMNGYFKPNGNAHHSH